MTRILGLALIPAAYVAYVTWVAFGKDRGSKAGLSTRDSFGCLLLGLGVPLGLGGTIVAVVSPPWRTVGLIAAAAGVVGVAASVAAYNIGKEKRPEAVQPERREAPPPASPPVWPAPPDPDKLTRISDSVFTGPGVGEYIDALFADTRSRTATRNGNDVETTLSVDADQAASGGVWTARFATAVRCEACGGSGAAPGSAVEGCDRCGGSGQVQAARRSFLGNATVGSDRCPQCEGTGSLVSQPCRDCRGSGRAPAERTVRFNVPSGVKDGTRLRLPGQGEAGARGGPPGDLYIHLRVDGADESRRGDG